MHEWTDERSGAEWSDGWVHEWSLDRTLLGTHGFTRQLDYMSLRVPLQTFCRNEALKCGAPVRKYYRDQNLADVLGKLQFKTVPGIDPSDVRQDAAAVGLPLPPPKPGWPDKAEEDSVSHMLRLVALGIQKRFDDTVAAVVAKHGGEGASVKKCPMKGHARMTNKLKAADDHRYEAKPRPAKNIDIVRTCVTLATQWWACRRPSPMTNGQPTCCAPPASPRPPTTRA